MFYSLILPMTELCKFEKDDVTQRREYVYRPDPDGGPDDFEIPQGISDDRLRRVEFYRNSVIDELHIIPAVNEAERLKFLQARALVLEQLALSHAPYSEREVACVIETGDSVVQFIGGHNHEHANGDFEHAEPSALSDFIERFPGRKIKRLFMIGYGQDKEKKISPCQECYKALFPHLTNTSDIVLFSPVDFQRATVLTPEDYRPAYEAKEYCAVESETLEDIVPELLEKTALDEDDAHLIAELRLVGIENGIEFFLSGSASGRGWVSNAIHKAQGAEKQYNDLDIIAVSFNPESEVERVIENVINSRYRNFSKEVTVHHIQGETATRTGIKYTAEGMPPLEVQTASDLKKGMSRPDYFKNNFFIKLS
jgi:cytidine deaminase